MVTGTPSASSFALRGKADEDNIRCFLVEVRMDVLLIKSSVGDLFPLGQGRGHLMYRTLNSMVFGVEKDVIQQNR